MTGTNGTRDPDSVVAGWLDEGPTDLPDATRRAILTALPTTPQVRRGILAPTWLTRLNTFASRAAVLVFAVLAIGALALLPGHGPGVAPTSSPGPTPTMFQSPLYGYTITLPHGWTATAGTVRWDGESAPSLGSDVDQLAGPHLIALGYAGRFTGDLAAFTQDRIAANARDHGDTCPPNALELNQPIAIGGQPGVLLGLNCGARIDQAITVHNGVAYAFTIRDAEFSSTIDPTDFASVQSMLASLTFPTTPTTSP